MTSSQIVVTMLVFAAVILPFWFVHSRSQRPHRKKGTNGHLNAADGGATDAGHAGGCDGVDGGDCGGGDGGGGD